MYSPQSVQISTLKAPLRFKCVCVCKNMRWVSYIFTIPTLPILGYIGNGWACIRATAMTYVHCHPCKALWQKWSLPSCSVGSTVAKHGLFRWMWLCFTHPTLWHSITGVKTVSEEVTHKYRCMPVVPNGKSGPDFSCSCNKHLILTDMIVLINYISTDFCTVHYNWKTATCLTVYSL